MSLTKDWASGQRLFVKEPSRAEEEMMTSKQSSRDRSLGARRAHVQSRCCGAVHRFENKQARMPSYPQAILLIPNI